jgi:hypothetical protein
VEKVTQFYLTAHLKRRLEERGLLLELLKDVIKYPNKRTQQRRGEHAGFNYRHEKTVDGNTLIVVAEIKKHECWIVTGYYEAS